MESTFQLQKEISRVAQLIRPENWERLNIPEKVNFVIKQNTGVCDCKPAIKESCYLCKPLINLKENKIFHCSK